MRATIAASAAPRPVSAAMCACHGGCPAGRDPNPQIAFGIGTHFCLGANLARLELRIMIEALVRRFPDMRVAPDSASECMASTLVRGIDSLPVVFAPA